MPPRASLPVLLLATACTEVADPTVGGHSGEPSAFITDDQGRALVLRGLNVDNAAKADPERMPHLEPGDVARIAQRWGFNLVRLLVFWDALEPAPGAIDAAYLDRVEARVDELGAAGIHVLLDLHQDVYAARFCCDGAPGWAIHDDGLPFEQKELWSLNYLEPAVQRAFDHFWDADGAHPELQEHYAGAWQALARRFGGHPAVVGYDLMNEPFPGSDFDVAEAILRTSPADGGSSRRFDETKLGPFYQRLIDALRAVDADTPVFVEPRYAAPANGSPSYLPLLVDPRPGAPRLVSAPHLYSVGLESNGEYSSTDRTVPLWEQERGVELARQPMPLVIGEWGFAGSTVDGARFADDVLALADRLMAGWAYWSFDPGGPGSWALFDRATGEDLPLAAQVVRPYPRAVAGEPLAFAFDPATRVFTLRFRQRRGATGATELFVAPLQYPEGWTLTSDTDAEGTWSREFDAQRGVVTVTFPEAPSEHALRLAPLGRD